LCLHGCDAVELHVQCGFQLQEQFLVTVEAFNDGFDNRLEDGRENRLDCLKNCLRRRLGRRS
jgi:hypothetical protein